MAGSTAIVSASEYTLMGLNPDELSETIQDNLGGEQLSQFSLPQIKVPAGGGTAWSLPTLGDDEVAREFTGIIIYHTHNRQMWRVGLNDEGSVTGTPPDCSSADGVIGYGDPGGRCQQCALARFGPNRERPLCKQTHIMYVMRPDDVLPVVVTAPPTSLASVREYILKLTSQAVPYYAAVTRFSLEQAKSGDGKVYSRIKLSFVEKLVGTEREAAKAYNRSIQSVILRPRDLGNGVAIHSSDGDDDLQDLNL